MTTRRGFLGAAGMACLAGCAGRSARADYVVFAAASTAPLLAALPFALAVNAAASATITRQLLAGAQADVVVTANPYWMERLEDAGRLRDGSRRDLFGNALVLAVPSDVPARPLDAASDPTTVVPKRLALGDPAYVPVGGYARAALEAYGWWAALAPRVVPAGDARAALRLVETGAVDAGVLYRSDAAASSRVTIIHTFDPASHPAIVYPGAVLADTLADTPPDAGRILAAIGPDVIERFGFVALPS